LSIYESGRERTKRVVRKEYPLVNINKLPSILTKGNDNIGVVWKNTNKIQSHTLFSTSNLPNREPASKDDIFYLVAPFKEPKSVNIIEEFKKCKKRIAKENQNRYQDIKSKIEKSKIIPSTKLNDSTSVTPLPPSSQLSEKKLSSKVNDQNKFDSMGDTYEESIKRNFIPLISTFSTNPLVKTRFIDENGLDKTNKDNNESLHKVKKKINRNKSQVMHQKLKKQNKINDSIPMNKNLFNNFGTLINSVKPLDSIISAKPIGVSSFITNKGVIIPNIDFLNDSLGFSKNKKEEILLNETIDYTKLIPNDILYEDQSKMGKVNEEDEFLSNLLAMNENDKNFLNSNGLNRKLESVSFLGDIYPKSFMGVPKPQRAGSLDEILAPFKVPVDSSKVKVEQEGLTRKNGFDSFNCFNFEEMDLPKLNFSQEIGLSDIDMINNNSNNKFINDEILKKELSNSITSNEIFKKEFPSPPREHGNYESLGEIAKFSTNVLQINKLKNVKMGELDMKAKIESKSRFDFNDGFDMSKVKKEDFDSMTLDIFGNQPTDLTNLHQDINPSLSNVNEGFFADIFNNTTPTNDNHFMNVDHSLLNSDNANIHITNNDLLQNDCVDISPNMTIDCYNSELNFMNSPYLLPNTLDYTNNILSDEIKPKDGFLPSPESKLMKDLPYNAMKIPLDRADINTICDINPKVKDEFIQGCNSMDIPLATTATETNMRIIPDWYNQNEIDLLNNNNGLSLNNNLNNTINININSNNSNDSSSDSPLLIKPLVPNTNSFIPDYSKEILNDDNQYTPFLGTEIASFSIEENTKMIDDTDMNNNHQESDKITINNINANVNTKNVDSNMNIDAEVKARGIVVASSEKKNDELSESIIDEIIDRMANDDQLKDIKSNESCFIGCTLQETGKLIKKMSKEVEDLSSKSDQLESSEKKWKEWRKEILTYEDEAHQWLNARIEFYSRRVNEYRKDWIEYWIKRYLMQQKQQIESLSYYIDIPQNLQYATTAISNSMNTTKTTKTTTTTITSETSCNTITANTTNSTMPTSASFDKPENDESNGETSEQGTGKTTTTTLIAVKAEIDKDPHLEVIGRTIEVANKELLNNPSMIKEYHEKLLEEKKLLLEKYDIVDSLDLVPSELIKPIIHFDNNKLIQISDNGNGVSNEDNKGNEMKIDGKEEKEIVTKKSKIILPTSGEKDGDNSKGFKSGRKNQGEISSVLIDEYVKAPFASKRIFINGIPKDYQLMFNDKMKSLIFILDKCIQDKKDLYHTMEENRKQYFIKNETKKEK